MSLSIRNAEFTNSRIVGLGTYRPRREVTNAEVCEWILSSDEWITTRSGIRSRRFAGQDETLSAMAIIAGRRALEHAGIDADELDGIIVASMSNLVQTPPLAISVAVGLGAANAGGFDVSAACAGFCHALAVASDTVRTGDARYVLVIGVERMSDIVDRTDREVAFLFADGAGAVVVGRSEEPGISAAVRGADHRQPGRAADEQHLGTVQGRPDAHPAGDEDGRPAGLSMGADRGGARRARSAAARGAGTVRPRGVHPAPGEPADDRGARHQAGPAGPRRCGQGRRVLRKHVRRFHSAGDGTDAVLRCGQPRWRGPADGVRGRDELRRAGRRAPGGTRRGSVRAVRAQRAVGPGQHAFESGSAGADQHRRASPGAGDGAPGRDARP